MQNKTHSVGMSQQMSYLEHLPRSVKIELMWTEDKDSHRATALVAAANVAMLSRKFISAFVLEHSNTDKRAPVFIVTSDFVVEKMQK